MSRAITSRQKPYAMCLFRGCDAEWGGRGSTLGDVAVLDAAEKHHEETGHTVVLTQTSMVEWTGTLAPGE